MLSLSSTCAVCKQKYFYLCAYNNSDESKKKEEYATPKYSSVDKYLI